MVKKAFIHEWFTVPAGSELCVESFTNIWNDFDFFALVDFMSNEDRAKYIKGKPVTTSFIQNLPLAEKHFRNYLPLFPIAVEQFDLSGYQLIFSNSHAVAKGVLTRHNQLHVCYCHSPIRYAWDLYHQYLREGKLERGVKSAIARYMLHRMRNWDFITAGRVDYYMANSAYTAARIKKIYGREAAVIYPPVDVHKFSADTAKEEYYLTASRLVPYKRIDLIVEAFAKMPDKKLLVIGQGPEMHKVKAKATRNIEVLGYQPDSVLHEHMKKAKAFLFAAEEDFGIIVVEALACGTPVIAFNRGGTAETVTDGVTGIHFTEQTAAAIMDAVRTFEKQQHGFNPAAIRLAAERFSRPRFEQEVATFVNNKIEAFFG